MPDNRLFGQGIGLRGVLIPRWLVSQCLNKLVSKDLYIGPLIGVIFNLHRLLLWLEVPPSIFLLLGILNIFQCHKCGMGVAPKDALVPHKVVIDEFAGDRRGGTFIIISFIRVRVICISSWA